MVRRLVIAVMAVAVGLLAVPFAQADTGDIIEKQNVPPSAKDGWQAATCTTETPKCSPTTPGQIFNKAGGHPNFAFTQYIVKHNTVVEGVLEEPLGVVKTLRVDLPPGLTVNPQATLQCTLADFEKTPTGCSPLSQVGQEEVTVALSIEIPNPSPPPATLPPKFVIAPNEPQKTLVPLYNLVPKEGEPALFGFKVGAAEAKVFLTTEIAWESDYHSSFEIATPPPNPVFKTLKSRLVNKGQSGDGTYITNPTTCYPAEPPFKQLYSTFMRADSFAEPDADFPSGLTPFEAPLPPGQLVECDKVPFEPALQVDAGVSEVDSPAAPTVTTTLPFDPAKEGKEGISQSHLRKAVVTLPQGMGLNPSGANGLESCTNAQFGKGTRNETNSCPVASKVGTVEIETPPLPPGSLKGDVYVGQQLSRDPTSGEEFRIFVEASSIRFGIHARLIGNISANPQTGQLTATFDEQPIVTPFVGTLPSGLPQTPFTSVKLHFDAAKRTLSSPPTCATATTNSVMEPWSTPASTKMPASSFTLTSLPGGGTCPKTMAERPFAPGYTAKTDSTKAAAKSPFRVHIARPDGQQELKVVDVTLPKGLTGKLAGLEYCSESAIAAAAADSGVAVVATPGCPDKSFLGTAQTSAGTGNDPLKIAGNAYLAGPYKGAPLSMAVITPAVAGPYDLGNVVVRVALFVNPLTAQVNAVSDPIPDVFGGVKLDIRSIDVDITRKGFMRNPTNCKAQATSGVIKGGGANPTDPAAFSSYAVSAPFQATGCGKLGFKPKLFTRLYGPTTRAQNPRIRAILEARKNDANISRAALTLPHSLFLDQSHIRTVCTRVQLAADNCPKGAIYGHAKAKTPLLDKMLKGPVYLVSSDNPLPDLLADLKGQVNIQLHGVISSKRGGIKTVFTPLPDVEVQKFILNMSGGDKSLLVNSTNLCGGPQASVLNIKAQNGKKVKNNQLPLRVSACSKKK
jgi:hypothetical protein